MRAEALTSKRLERVALKLLQDASKNVEKHLQMAKQIVEKTSK